MSNGITGAVEWQDAITSQSKWLLLLIGFLQGLALYGLTEYLADSVSTSVQFVLYGLVLAIPSLVILIAEDLRSTRLWILLSPYVILMALLLAYTGAQCEGDRVGRCNGSATAVSLFTLAFFWCLVSFVFRASLERWGQVPQYADLLRFSWHNFFVVILAAIYTGLIWSVLLLGAGLFRLVDIEVFWDILQEDWFSLPLSGIAAAYGAVAARQQLTVVATLRRVLRTLISGLLPLLAAITLGFLLVLPFTGLQPLWDTKRASILLLSLVAHLLFFINATIRDDQQPHWPRIWRPVIAAALFALPVYLLITGYALWLRIDQYGWTVVRVWAVILALWLGGYAISYAWTQVTRRNDWTTAIGRINTRMLWVLMLVLILVNTPLLNIPKLVAWHQVERLLSGVVSVEDFDHRLLRYQLGKHGKEALDAMKQDSRYVALPERQQLEQALATSRRYGTPDAARVVREHLKPLPADLNIPEGLLNAIEDPVLPAYLRCENRNAVCYISEVSLREGVQQFLLLVRVGATTNGIVFEEVEGEWAAVGRVIDYARGAKSENHAKLTREQIKVVDPQWRDLEIFDRRMRVQPLNRYDRVTPVGTAVAPAIPVPPPQQ